VDALMARTNIADAADILRAAGVPVIEETYVQGPYKGKRWQDVGWQGQGYRDVKFIMWHHDASPTGDSPGALWWMMNNALAPAGCIWVCSGCNGTHASGTWHLIAGRLSNHAGTGGPGWGVMKDQMNAYAVGIETDHTYGESWAPPKKQAQLDSLRLGTAALMNAYGLSPNPSLLRHLDWTNGMIDGVPRLPTFGRKNDLDGVDIHEERIRVAALMRTLGKPTAADRIRTRIARLIRQRDKVKAEGGDVRPLTQRIRELRAKLRG
jgi:hypothetical protein